ncbi:MAG: aspartate/tyrosine/aromatic aminotransferase [Candidatus Hydrogenedentes bacterium]|nr:aspartate/tyrosine/aromatic aminotransferase [Candidatus Hydrogenedentota bacterium]MBI3117207.1 aspartate/tyrosine/aromatic aminotransferase [Candidatus Hydrogenedentota bacterium]
MFDHLEMAPPDSILGLTEAFKNDPRTNKINLGVGVYKDDNNDTPVLACVKRAEERLLREEKTKSYLAIPGSAEYGAVVRELLFGVHHEIVQSKRAVTAQTPGGTGGLRVAADFIHKLFPKSAIWLSEPTWDNHKAIFKAAGIEVRTYPYYDYTHRSLAFDSMVAALENTPEGDVVLLHACCHNPSGMDPNLEQWAALAVLVRERGLLPIFDFAYQGLGDGLEEDAEGMRLFCTPGAELLVCSSFSKNFGLYNERVGALTIVGASADAADRAFSQMKICIRTNYSNPPAHGGAVITAVLRDAELRAQWVQELTEMCQRINGMRRLFVERLQAQGVKEDFSFITRQKGMFSFSGLTLEQVTRLRETHGIYIVGSGRINVAGITSANIEPLCAAIASVLRG